MLSNCRIIVLRDRAGNAPAGRKNPGKTRNAVLRKPEN